MQLVTSERLELMRDEAVDELEMEMKEEGRNVWGKLKRLGSVKEQRGKAGARVGLSTLG
jgi:hypothetical protein